MTQDDHNSPVTPLQLGMIYHNLREGRTTGADVVQVEVGLPEAPDPARLEAAWDAVIHRHEALRRSFHWDEGEPVARVAPRVPVKLERRDLSTTGDPEAALADALQADRAKGFELDHTPILRLTLYRLAESDHRLIWTFHHVLADGTSYRHVLDEVFRLYDGSGPIDLAVLPPRPSPRVWEEWLAARSGEGDETFWKELLAEVQGPTPVPRVSGGAPEPGAWRYLTTTLDEGSTSALRRFARARGVTLNTLVQGAWALTLARAAGEDQVVFGSIVGGRAGTVEGAAEMVGLFIQTVPFPVTVDPKTPLSHFLGMIREQWVAMRGHEHASTADLQRWSGAPSGQLLFESVLNFQDPFWGDPLPAKGGPWAGRTVDLHNRLVYPLTVAVNGGETLRIRFEFDPAETDKERLEVILEHFATVLEALAGLAPEEGVEGAEQAAAAGAEGGAPLPDPRLRELPSLSPAQRALLEGWNATHRELPPATTVHGAFEATARRMPEAEALVVGEGSWSYGEVEAEANRIAHALGDRGVTRGDRVAVVLGRGPATIPALLGVMKAGAAYVPVDPQYPDERVRLMLEDSAPAAVVTDRRSRPGLPPLSVPILVADDPAELQGLSPETPLVPVDAGDAAYVIYTSGSTGRPKGVVVEHRNVLNFFVGMDDAVGVGPGDTWFAVTSISFDISVLELFWTLARGARVVVHGQPAPATDDGMAFSLFYFSAEGDEGAAPPVPGSHRYRLLLEGARFADQHGLSAIWTPERHFHEFGGIYPNPSVISAAVAAITERVRIRSGSVVLPLHEPIRVAEEWAVVDNLSDGRVELSFASGWHDRDFVFNPEVYPDRKAAMFRMMEEVRELWRGGAVERVGPSGETHALRIHPRPVQDELPIFVTAGGSPETFRQAGTEGHFLLTHLLGQKPEDLEAKIGIYREAWAAAGHPGRGHVAIMLHTFIGPDMETVRELTWKPFRNYLRTSVGLISAVAGSQGKDLREAKLTDEEMEALLDHAYDRYFETSALMGTVERCHEVVERLRGYGVDEVACLIDFGVDDEAVLDGLPGIVELMGRVNGAKAAGDAGPLTVSNEMVRTGATHLQCTPSQAAMILAEDDAAEALGGLRTLCVGGEAFPAAVARSLREHLAPEARLLNMYGPTETTIWSSVREVKDADLARATIPLGEPIANTQLLVVGAGGEVLPPGMEGELWIGGQGVVRGYLERPDLTSERFVPTPDAGWPGRFYRTGDRVRQRADGTMDFLGRIDLQVKLLGHRIELGEVEAALTDHAQVREAVVVVRTEAGAPETARLVAYLKTDGPVPERAALRAFLRDRLPEFMLPAEFAGMESFPLTPNGKVDRKRLPDPASLRRGAGGQEGAAASGHGTGAPGAGQTAPSAAVSGSGSAGAGKGAGSGGNGATSPAAGGAAVPAGKLEREIAAIWQEVLGTDRVGPDDNFFEIGGHSLLAVRVHSRITGLVPGKVSLVDLFRFPTVRSLAGHLGVSDEGAGAEETIEEARDRATSRRDALRNRGARRRGGR